MKINLTDQQMLVVERYHEHFTPIIICGVPVLFHCDRFIIVSDTRKIHFSHGSSPLSSPINIEEEMEYGVACNKFRNL